jgi:hypothetical protein
MARDRVPVEVDDALARWQTELRVLNIATPGRIAARGTGRRPSAVQVEALRHDYTA